MRIHLDTDLGGDTDDVCALAMLLGWPGVDLVGVTSTIDPEGWRAGYVEYCLDLAGRRGVPVAAGTAVSMTTRQRADPIVADDRYWPTEVTARSDPAGAALDLLAASIAQGATVVAIGPYTNLALLEIMRPGSLARVPIVVMGGWVDPPAAGLPAWGPDMDFNVQMGHTRRANRGHGRGGSDAGYAAGHPHRPPARLRSAEATRSRPAGGIDRPAGPSPRR